MAKFRKKPVVIEAMKWDGHDTEAIRDFTGYHIRSYQEELCRLSALYRAHKGRCVECGVKSPIHLHDKVLWYRCESCRRANQQ